jgi:hypothetical protein
LYLEVAEGIELKVTKASIAGKVRGDSDSTDAAKASETPATKSESDADGASETSSRTPSIARGWRKGR